MRDLFRLIVILLALGSLPGCAALVGAGAAGGAYEYKTKERLDKLAEDFKAGKITREEYLKQKEQIEKGSLVY
ncbi:hypothetical protein [Nitrosomonas sp. Nm33]|uniref:hypothetical protein n=1 Tax=Nitrosomonas sp. Nm33 TaxID=133724 RepID=UPI000895D66B|nr:hypothetical protein [Nitrosomonas sp. Nm33]SDX92224.1 hypothetical protein SAMN05421755_100256 [Nitrosomonas sp. Nm33]